MTDVTYPREWASAGDKTDPGVALSATGFEVGAPHSRAHFNYLFNEYSRIARWSVEQHLNSLAPITHDTNPASTVGMGAVYLPFQRKWLLFNGDTAGSHSVGDNPRGVTEADLGTLPTCRSVAVSTVTGRIVAVSAGAPYAAFSADEGVTWTDASSGPGEARDCVCFDPVNALFITSRVGDLTCYSSPTGATWTGVTPGGGSDTNTGGVACNSAGRTLFSVGTGTTVAFFRSTNGTSWAASGGTLPDVANASSPASVAALGSTLYAGTMFASDAEFRIHSTSDGITWTLLSTVTKGTLSIANSTPRLLADATSGALYMLMPAASSIGSGVYVWCSLDGGVNWMGPARYMASIDRIAVAGGRVFVADGTARWMTTMALPPA
jgi:hypothetical protein